VGAAVLSRPCQAGIGWYSGTRLHSSAGDLSPATLEATHRNEVKNVA